MEQQQENFTKQALTSIVTVDRYYNLKKVDNNFHELFGYNKEEVNAMSLVDISPNDYMPLSLELMDDVVTGKIKKHRFRKHYYRKGGKRVETYCLLNGKYNAKGEFTEATIEIQKKENPIPFSLVEQTIREYRLLLDGASMGIILYDLKQQKLIYSNKAIQRLFNRTEEEVLRLNPIKRIIPFQPDGRSSKEALLDFREKILNQKNVTIEWFHKRSDGSDLIMDIHAYALAPPKGSIIAVMIKDITDKKLAEVALKESEFRYRLLLEKNYDGILMYDLENWQFIDCNDKLCELFNATKDDFRKFKNKDVYPKHQPDGRLSKVVIKELFEQALIDGNCEAEVVYKRPHGGENIIFEVIVAINQDADDDIAIVLLRDMTERRKKERTQKELEKLQQELAFNAREISSNLVYLTDKNNTLSSIKKSLVDLSKKADPSLRNDLYKVIHRISRETNLDDDWKKFKLHFEKVHPEFFTKLKKQYPALSQRELKHCAYIQIGLNVKEVAQVLDISAKGVEMARYRIKKKMEICEGRKLSDFIQSLYTKYDL